MSDWSGNDYLNALARRPGASAPATLGQVWDAEWKRAGLDTITGVGKPLDDAQSELEDAVSGAAGMALPDYARQQGVDLSDAMSFDQRSRAVQTLAGTLPDEAKKKIEPILDVRRNAAMKAQKIEADANDVSAATYGLSGTATAWLAGLTRQSTDPINIAAMVATAPIGGPLEGALGKVLLRQAGAAGAAQAVSEPVVESARGDLGVDAGFKRAAENIAGAAIGGAGLAGLFRGGAYLLSRVRGRGVEAPAKPAAPGAEAEPFEPAPVSDYQTFGGIDQGGPIEHPAAAGTGAAGAPGFIGANLDIAAGAEARVQKGRAPAYEPGLSDYRPTELTHEDMAALDRGQPRPTTYGDPALSSGAADLSGFGHNLDFADGVRAMREFAPDDLEAAAKIAERDQVMDAQAAEAHTPVVEHNEKIAQAADALEAGPSEPPPAPVVKKRFGRAVQDPATFSALEYLAFRGGIRNDDPLINDLLQSFGGENPFVPGMGKLVRKPVSDRSPASAALAPASIDEAITRLKEGGYLFDPADMNGGPSQLSHTDVLALIDAEARGNKQYRLDYEPKAARDPAQEKAYREEQHAQIAATIDKRMEETDFPATKAIRKRAIEIMEREGEQSPLDALERALQEHDDRQEALRRERELERIEIPGWDIPASTDAGRASEAGRPLPGEPAERPGGAGERGDARGAGDGLREGTGGPAVGDPQLSADAARAIEQAPEIIIELPDGRRMTARAALAEAEEEARAAAEFKNCTGGGTVDGGSDEIPF